MHALLLASSLLAGGFVFAGEAGYDQVTWSTPQIIFGEPRSPSTVPLDNWATTVRLGELAWSLSSDKFAATVDISNVVAERSQ